MRRDGGLGRGLEREASEFGEKLGNEHASATALAPFHDRPCLLSFRDTEQSPESIQCLYNRPGAVFSD